MTARAPQSSRLNACISPTARDSLTPGSRDRLIAQEALRIRWHQLFDRIPQLAERLPDTTDLYEAFLEWAVSAGRQLDWRMHLHFLEFLNNEGIALQPQDHIELLAASAARWFASPEHRQRGLALTTGTTAPKVVVALKGRSPLERGRVKLAQVPGLEPAPGIRWSLSRSGDFAALDWSPL
ncbi:hypothetical protein [Streptomyces sp. NBC_01205]|uniref:hypothetical protein n=1 Tax=Streptomyces sp. NBC_01205 TaxID=2903771 RepID=UPI002E15F552|nr:hypothetical protein OG573_10285 [Streptomyces sp. NBC_01205]